MILAILASLILWPLYLAVFLVLAIIGLVLLLPLSLLKAWRWRFTRVFPDLREVSAWRGGWLTWVWGNEEDGVTGPDWWLRRTKGSKAWLVAYRWSALRNPVNNLRFIRAINPVIDPKRVRAVRWDSGFFCWQGAFAGVMHFPVIRGQVFRFWLGWKLKPEDRHGVPATDFRAHGCGFAIQFKRI
jgi:hypothetical protein